MGIATVFCRACLGVVAPEVTVEVHLAPGMTRFSLVGLPETVVKESKERVRSAIQNSQFCFPQRRITVNLAPADLPKQGGRFDLAIAIGILAASKQLPVEQIMPFEFAGELALSGAIRPVRGMLSWIHAAQASGRQLIIPAANAEEAALIQREMIRVMPVPLTIYYANHLLAVCEHIRQTQSLNVLSGSQLVGSSPSYYPPLSDVRGQSMAKRALQIAAAGGHHLLLKGPPGSGKTMLASRLPGLLPDLNYQEALEVAMIYDLHSRGFTPESWKKRPYCAPHHTASVNAIVGGGRPPSPGDISLAHHGVLFLDEIPEFQTRALEALREPIERGVISISRVGVQVTWPAQFQLVAAMNPCPCGYYGDDSERCQCAEATIVRYQNRLSGPLLDRIDLQLTVSAVPATVLWDSPTDTVHTQDEIKNAIQNARQRQYDRQKMLNSQLSFSTLTKKESMHHSVELLLKELMCTSQLSVRMVTRLLRVARTIADLANESSISQSHLQEVLLYRPAQRTVK